MRVEINGREEELSGPVTMADLLRSLDVEPQRVAVEVNGDLLPRDRYDATALSSGDHIEIVTFVGGG